MSSEPQNWVQRRAQQETLLDSKAMSVFQEARAAAQSAVEDFQRIYKRHAHFRPENGHRFHVARGNRDTLTVHFDQETLEITVTGNSTSNIQFEIQTDGETVYIASKDGSKVTPDEFSRRVLEPLLFPAPTAEPFNYRVIKDEDED